MLFSFQPGGVRAKHLCVHWEGSEEGGSWSTEGCTHVASNDSYTKCKCFHLSSFAVLMALAPKVPRFMVPSCESECVQEIVRSSSPCLRKRLKIRSQEEVAYLKGSSRKHQQGTREVKWEKDRSYAESVIKPITPACNWSLIPSEGF